MTLFLKPKNFLLGVDIGAHSIKIIKLNKTSKGVIIDKIGFAELPINNGEGINEETKSDIIRNLLNNNKIKDNYAVSMISGREVTIRYVSLPKMPQEELKEAVMWEAKKQLSYPIEEATLDFIVVDEAAEHQTNNYLLMLVAAPRNIINEHLQIFKKAGLYLAAIDINSMALLSYFDLNYEWEKDKRIAIIDFGAGKTNISVVKNKTLRFTRDIFIAGIEITSAIKDGLNIDFGLAEDLKKKYGLNPSPEIADSTSSLPIDQETIKKIPPIIESVADRLALEIQRSFDYFQAQFHENSIDKIILTGGSSNLIGITEYFSKMLSVPVEKDNFTKNIHINANNIDIEQNYLNNIMITLSTGIGLATRKMGE